MTVYDELVARGLIAQVTDEEEIKELETLFGRGGMWVKAVAAVAGSVIYRFIIALALRANVPSECLKLISAVIVALAIAAPALKAKADFRRRRANAQKGGARHA